LSKCADDVGIIAVKTLSSAGAGQIAADYLKKSSIRVAAGGGKAAQQITAGADIGVRETINRFIREGELPEDFVRPGEVQIKAAKGKIGAREAQEARIMNQFGLAEGYAFTVAQARSYYAKTGNTLPNGIIEPRGQLMAVEQLHLHDSILRNMGVPLTTVKVGVLDGVFHYSHLVFGDIARIFGEANKLPSFAEYFLRHSDATKNIPSQNASEAVRRIMEHADTYGKIDVAADIDLLRPQVIDALTNPSGLAKPKANTAARAGYDKSVAWLKSKQGSSLVEKLADDLLQEDMLRRLVKSNEEMRLINMVMSKGDGLRMTDQVFKMITSLPNPNDRMFAYGDFLRNDRFADLFKNDTLVKMTPEELNLAFGQNFLAKYFAGIDDGSLIMTKAMADRSTAHATDIAASKKTGKKVGKNRKEQNQREFENISEGAAVKAKKNMDNPDVRAQEPSLEAAELAERYRLEFDVGPLLGGPVRAFNWLSDKSTMGGKMKTALLGTEHFHLENAATMSAQLNKFFDAYGRNNELFNSTFIALQKIDLSSGLDDAIAAMPAQQGEIAQGMADFIQRIFGAGSRNNLDMNGIAGSEMIKSMKSLGLSRQADFIQATSGYADDAWGEWWKTIDLADGENALSIMGKTYAAMQLTRIKPTIAASLRHHFDHTADGLTRKQAIAAGYKPISDKTPLGSYLNEADNPPLFHPMIINKISGVNAHLEYERAFSGNWQKFFAKADPIVGVLKSSITIWRPGHHMVSFIGNTLFNTAAGVTVGDYAVAMKMIARRGDILDLDETALTQALREGAPEGYVLKNDGDLIPMLLDGKMVDTPLEVLLRGADEISGVPISARRAADRLDDNNPGQFGFDGITRNNPALRGFVKADQEIAKVAAIRDNLARYAMFINVLRKGSWKNLEDAFLEAGQKVHEFHPTVGTLTAGERKYARRLFYFYTWQKQALFKIAELAANQPAWMTMPSKIQYAIASGNGMNPESFGDGWDPNGLYASYFNDSVFAPQMRDEDLGAIGIRPASPQLDVIDAYFAQFSVQPGRGFWEGMGEMMGNAATGIFTRNVTPLARIPAELATGNRVGDMGGIRSVPEYLLDQTGLGSLTRAAGFTPWGEQRTDFKDGEYGEKDRERQWWNWLLGFKTTYYESPPSLERARQERIDYWQRYYKSGKYAEDK
jgi:hypothetical protein